MSETVATALIVAVGNLATILIQGWMHRAHERVTRDTNAMTRDTNAKVSSNGSK